MIEIGKSQRHVGHGKGSQPGCLKYNRSRCRIIASVRKGHGTAVLIHVQNYELIRAARLFADRRVRNGHNPGRFAIGVIPTENFTVGFHSQFDDRPIANPFADRGIRAIQTLRTLH
ncbi:hypothetical protein D1872_260640 [compost metagenome]